MKLNHIKKESMLSLPTSLEWSKEILEVSVYIMYNLVIVSEYE
jgi:hypothetical protein